MVLLSIPFNKVPWLYAHNLNWLVEGIWVEYFPHTDHKSTGLYYLKLCHRGLPNIVLLQFEADSSWFFPLQLILEWFLSDIKQKYWNTYLCLVHLQVPKCFGLVQIFCASPNIYLHIVAVTNILCQTKRWFAFRKIGFCAGTKVFEEALNAVKFLGWLKKFGPAQNILAPVKGQGIRKKTKMF